PSFTLTAQNAAAVAALCRALDGLPLALELVASRTKMLTPAALVGRLDRALDLSAGGDARPSRQRTLRATVEWSVELLRPDVRDLLSYVAVFSGGATLEALEAVVSAEILEPDDLLDMLFELVDASLVTVSDGPDGSTRFNTLETIRRFALDRIESSGHLS